MSVQRDQNAAGRSVGSGGTGGGVASRLEQQQDAMRGTIDDGGKGLKELGMCNIVFHKNEEALGLRVVASGPKIHKVEVFMDYKSR